MADYGNSIGGLLQGFNSTYFPGIRANEAEKLRQDELALRKAQDERANQLQQFQLQKYAEAEAKDRQGAAAGLGLLNIKPTMYKSLDGAEAEAAGDFMPEVANPKYDQMLAAGKDTVFGVVKQQRENELAALKARTDAWKEVQAQRMADLKDKQIMAMAARGGGKGKPVLFMDEANRPFYINVGDPIPPGAKPYDKKAEGLTTKAEQANQDKLANANLVLEDIGRAKKLADEPLAVGFGAETVSRIAGTPAGDLSKMLDGIRANIGFDKLQAMRAASPTGGALGQVSDLENRLLQSTMGSLLQSQSPAQFKATLNRLENQYQDIVHGQGNRPGHAAPGAPRVRTFNQQTGRLE